MQIIYVPEEIMGAEMRPVPTTPNSIFLAGPTPRDEFTPSWRPEALRILKELGFTGTVFIPEARGGGWANDYDTQVVWEWTALAASSAVVFWVPRELSHMPAFTTNVELGFIAALRGSRIAFGAPEDAPKNRYLQSLVNQSALFHGLFGTGENTFAPPCASTLKETLHNALSIAKRQ